MAAPWPALPEPVLLPMIAPAAPPSRAPATAPRSVFPDDVQAERAAAAIAAMATYFMLNLLTPRARNALETQRFLVPHDVPERRGDAANDQTDNGSLRDNCD